MEVKGELFLMIRFNVQWLPDLIKYNPETTWDEYIEGIYQYFKEDFIDTKLVYKGETLALKRFPERMGKEATFYHITTKGDDEEIRLSDLPRCERIRWPKAIIESNYVGLKIWENQRKTKKNIVIWFEEKEYLIIIRKNATYKMFWTAYPVTEDHTKRKLQREYENFQKAKTAP